MNDIEILEKMVEEYKDKIKKLEQENNFLKIMYRGTEEFKALERFTNEGGKYGKR